MIYFAQAEGVGHIKIGFHAGDDAADRLANLQTGSPVKLRLLGTLPGTADDEKNLHRRFASSRIHGEWFQPTPELVALIDPRAVLTCNGHTIAEKSVTIRVLTVGRKQFGKALLLQLPERSPIDWRDLVQAVTYEKCPLEFDPSKADCLVPFLRGELWGWVQADPFRWFADFEYQQCSASWIIYVSDGALYRWHDPNSSVAFANRVCDLHDHRVPSWKLAGAIHRARKKLLGWRDEDQLFFGV